MRKKWKFQNFHFFRIFSNFKISHFSRPDWPFIMSDDLILMYFKDYRVFPNFETPTAYSITARAKTVSTNNARASIVMHCSTRLCIFVCRANLYVLMLFVKLCLFIVNLFSQTTIELEHQYGFGTPDCTVTKRQREHNTMNE